MSFSKLSSAQTFLLQIQIIDIEVDISKGLNAFSIVGLPDKAVEEAKERVSAAIKNSGFESPKSKNQKLTISLAPAELRKEGSNFDLAIALAYLLSVDDIRFDPSDKIFLGELSLDGSLRPIKGALSLVIGAKKRGVKEIYIPYTNKDETSIIEGIDIFPVRHLREIIEHLDTKKEEGKKIDPLLSTRVQIKNSPISLDFKDIKGQKGAKRALEIAAAGGHNILLYGPPGTGKTMLAKAFSSLIPELSFDEMIEVTSIYSSYGYSVLCTEAPFRAPHHSASYVSMVGGGSYPKPGEVTLAHRGVLFMDEFPEFDSRVIESLRQPLEEQYVVISRAKTSIQFPSDFILLGSMNPCPCGFLGSKQKECVCTNRSIQRYQRKISGPIVDRIDIWIEVSEIPYEKLSSSFEEEDTHSIKRRVEKTRLVQTERFKDSLAVRINSRMNSRDISSYCILSEKCQKLINNSAQKLSLSPRMYHRTIKLSRTIADLDNKKDIEESHILEALQYRPKLKLLNN